ncbi:MAG: N-acetyltransferase [Bacteroidia bacterium]|nr:N-acetyltransferase [Bacteroidia bacterium]
MNIRLALESDIVSINEIYNQSILTGYSTCDTEPIPISERVEWFKNHNPKTHPILVADIDGIIVGWISLSEYRPGRSALAQTVEVSYFIDKNFQNKGIGSQLMDRIIKEAKEIGHKNVFAILLENNERSIALLKNFEFKQWAHLPEVAVLNGSKVGQVYYGLTIKFYTFIDETY